MGRRQNYTERTLYRIARRTAFIESLSGAHPVEYRQMQAHQGKRLAALTAYFEHRRKRPGK